MRCATKPSYPWFTPCCQDISCCVVKSCLWLSYIRARVFVQKTFGISRSQNYIIFPSSYPWTKDKWKLIKKELPLSPLDASRSSSSTPSAANIHPQAAYSTQNLSQTFRPVFPPFPRNSHLILHQLQAFKFSHQPSQIQNQNEQIRKIWVCIPSSEQ